MISSSDFARVNRQPRCAVPAPIAKKPDPDAGQKRRIARKIRLVMIMRRSPFSDLAGTPSPR